MSEEKELTTETAAKLLYENKTESNAEESVNKESEGDSNESLENTDSEEKVEEKVEEKESSESNSEGKAETQVEAKEVVYDLKLPEGSILKEESIEDIKNIAKELGMTNEQAMAMLSREDAAVKAHNAYLESEFKERAEKWVDEIKSDKELGGDNLKQNIALASRVLDKYSTPEFKKVLNETGFGNHPELVRIFVRIGNQSKEDTFEKGSNKNATGDVRAADILYPSSKKG